MSSGDPSKNRQPGTSPPQAVPVTPGPPTAQPVPVNAPRAVPVAAPVAQPLPPSPVVNPMLPPGASPPTAPAATPVPVRPNPVPAATPTPVPVPAPVPTVAPTTANPAQPVALRPQPVPNPNSNRPIPVNTAATIAGLPIADEEDEEDEQQEDAAAWAMEKSPPWLVSLVFHTIVLIILGIWGFMSLPDETMQLEMVYAEKLGEQIEDDLFQAADSELLEIEEPVMSLDDEFVDDPLAAPPELDVSIDAVKSTSDLATPTIGLALTGREKGMKEALLAAYGGTATTEAAVKMGLEWLKKNQGKDGLWSLTGPYSTGSGVENRAAATAMALLAFQGAGHTHKTGEHREVVARGWAAMLKTQDADGNFFREGSFHHRLYTHAQATIAICELYGMTRDAKYKAPAQKALDYCFRIQSPAGGWRYAPNGESDTSVTGWFVMALQSGLMAGLNVPSEKLANISKYLDMATTDGGSQYGYRPGYGEKISMTAEGLLCRQYLGWKHDDPRLVRGANIVGENPMNWDEQDVYYWYYATQMLHHMGGEWWNKWNRVMRQTVPERQTKIGREKGSWSPSDDAWGHQGGRLFTTCLSIYMLEVYYRHLPIYKSTLR